MQRKEDLALGRDLGCLQSFRTPLNLEGHGLALNEGLETFSGNRRVMYENILSTIGGSNKTKTLGLVKPLYSACVHTKCYL